MNDTLVTTYQLNQLAAKLHSHEPLGHREINVLEKSVEILSGSSAVSSEIVSISNNIWCLIQEQPVQTFWITISTILTSAKIAHTKSLSLNSISRRIAFDWPHLDEQQKVNITHYIFSLQSEAIERGNDFGMVGEVIIALLRLEWDGLLIGFITRTVDNLKTMPAKNILYNLQLLRRLLRESFDTWTTDFSTEQYQNFKILVENQLRAVMLLTCFCLINHPETNILIPATLKFLLQIIDIVPVFEVFNCELLEVLLKLSKNKDYARISMKCLREIFSFKENGITQEHHSKIARRLFSILQKEIGQNFPPKRTVTNFDKQSTSTADSLGSKVTVSLNKTKGLSPDLLELLYLYLTRYVPSMDSRPDEKYFEIEFSSSTKLLFSKELYDYFEKGFWKFVQFLIEFGRKSDQKLSVLSDQQQEVQLKYLASMKLILILFGKLGLSYEEILEELIQLYILRLAPLQKAFRKYYILFDLIMDQNNAYIQLDEVHNFSDEYCQNYIEGMELIFKNRILSQIYNTVLQKLLDRILQVSSENINPLKKKMINDLCYKVNLVNRVSWSLIHGFRAGGEGYQQISINRIVGRFIQQTIEASDVIMKKCYSLNSKYILQAFKGTQFAPILFSSFLSNSSDIVYEFNIILISNIFLHPTFSLKDLGNQWLDRVQKLLSRVRQIKEIGTYSDEFNLVYPAIFRLAMKTLQYRMEIQQDYTYIINIIKEWLEILIYDELNTLLQATVSKIFLDIPTLKKINLFLANLEDIAALLLQECETREKGTYWMLKHYLVQLKEILKMMGFKYKLYSDYVQCQTYENFQVTEIIQFRQRYNYFVCNTIKLFSLRTKIEMKDDNITPERKAKMIKERAEIVQTTEQRLFEDFQIQIEFKCCSYFNVALQYYKYLVNQKKPNYSDIINKSIKSITTVLEQERVANVERLTTAKLQFWKNLIENFMAELRNENIEEFCNMYTKFAQYTAANAQTCLQMIERVLQKFDSQYKEGEIPALWSHFAVIFKITFERLFDQVCKNEEMFKRVAHILYFSVAVADGTQRKLAGPTQGKKSNVQVLFLFIREHVSSTLGDCGQHQELLLQSVFKERNKQRFINKMRDYKIGLMRWLKHNSNQS